MRRWVIDFEAMSEAEARRWPDLFAIVDTRVKPERSKLRDDYATQRRLKQFRLQYGSSAKELYAAILVLDRVLAASQTEKDIRFALLASKYVFSDKIAIFALCEYTSFATLQSKCHITLAQSVGSTMKDDPVYTPSDCF